MPNPPRPGRHWPRPETEYEWQDGWARPEPPRRAAPPPPQRPPRTQQQQRAAARRARERRRRRRRTFFLGTVVGILALSGVITVLLPKSVTGEPEATPAPQVGST